MTGTLWAVTSHFNPAGYRRRRANYRVFRRRLPMPLLTVEWSVDGRFELQPGDADILVQVSGGDVMWQKERLLNLGIARLPPQCTQVAWVDADLVFERADLATAIDEALARFPVVQLYDRVEYQAEQPIGSLETLARDTRWPAEAPALPRRGAAAADLPRAVDRRDAPAAAAAVDLTPGPTEQLGIYVQRPTAGFAWAARRELLERHPLFDTWLVGGGDNAFYHAIRGTPENLAEQHRLSPAHRGWYLPRARALARAVGGRIGHVPGRILSLWHGHFEDRQYSSRHAIPARHGFDPSADIALDAAAAVWRWTGRSPALAAEVRAYFDARHEDGR